MIKDLRFKIGYSLIGLFVYLFIGSIPAKAGSLSLSIDPPIIEINALPPSTVTSSLKIQNKTDTQVSLKLQLKPFKAKSENGQLEYLETSSDQYVNKTLFLRNVKLLDNGVPIEILTLGPRQEKNLALNVNILQETTISARPPATSSNESQTNQAGVAGEVGRDYYFSILFISDNTSSPTSNASLNQLGIASNVLLSVGPKETPNAILEEFSSGLFFEKGPVPFTIRIKNKGKHFIKPKGEILIKNMLGQSIGKLDLMTVNILADSTRAIPNNAYMNGISVDFLHPIALWKEDLLLGFYTATLNISLSNYTPSFTKSIRFFAFPFQGLILTIITVIAIIVVRSRLKIYMKK